MLLVCGVSPGALARCSLERAACAPAVGNRGSVRFGALRGQLPGRGGQSVYPCAVLGVDLDRRPGGRLTATVACRSGLRSCPGLLDADGLGLVG
jgi:hypothetical protein